jgi:hypothetical protein
LIPTSDQLAAIGFTGGLSKVKDMAFSDEDREKQRSERKRKR